MICIARTLGAPESVPAGSTAAQRVERADPAPQPPDDAGDDVHHVAVVLDDHELVDLDGAVLADPAEVVAAEVDEHHVLGALLLVGEQLVGHPAVLLGASRRAAACRRSAGSRRGRPETVISGSGLAPAISKSPKSRKYMYGLGLTARSPR